MIYGSSAFPGIGILPSTTHASVTVMGPRTFSDLDAWQLSNDLKLGVYELIRHPDVQHDLKFRGQIEEAARSAERP